MAFSPKGDFLAIGMLDGRVLQWRLNSGTFENRGVVVEGGAITAIAYSGDGTRIATARGDFLPVGIPRRISGLDEAVELNMANHEKLCGFVGRNLSEEEWANFVGREISYRVQCYNYDRPRAR
jgi:hypothetical protein